MGAVERVRRGVRRWTVSLRVARKIQFSPPRQTRKRICLEGDCYGEEMVQHRGCRKVLCFQKLKIHLENDEFREDAGKNGVATTSAALLVEAEEEAGLG